MATLKYIVDQIVAIAEEAQTAELEKAAVNFTLRRTPPSGGRPRLSRRTHYLQVALNSSLAAANTIIANLPVSERIILEAGTPLIKREGLRAVQMIAAWGAAHFGRSVYVVADLKTMDRGATEVDMAADAGERTR